jgi:hypothetical protein
MQENLDAAKLKIQNAEEISFAVIFPKENA